MTSTYNYQVNLLKEATNRHLDAYGASLCGQLEKAAKPLLDWLSYLKASHVTGTADVLLNGVQAAVIETAGCLTLGLVRPALFSFRAQIDMLLSWLYFKDHPIEWEHIHTTGEGYKLKNTIIDYLASYFPLFKKRFGILKQGKIRIEEEPYRLLSAHIHCQSTNCVPTIGNLDNLIRHIEQCNECVEIQKEVSEYLNDILFACLAENWASIPQAIVDDTTKRLTKAQQKDFFQ